MLNTADPDHNATEGPQLLDFESCLVHEGLNEMRFDFENGLWSFYLAREIPYLIGTSVEMI